VHAIRKEDEAGVRELLAAAASPHEIVDGATPIVHAAEAGADAIVRLLIDTCAREGCAPADLVTGRPDEEPRPALMLLIRRGRAELARSLILGGPPLERHHAEHLIQRISAGPADAPSLIQAVLERDRRQWETWQVADSLRHAAEGGHPGLVEALLAMGVPPQNARGSGKTALMAAAGSGRDDIVRLLLARNAHLNTADDEGNRAIHVAVRAGKQAEVVVALLAEAGCDMAASNKAGRTASDEAIKAGWPELATTIRDLAPRSGPRFMREARARRIGIYVFQYNKATGLAFNPHDTDFPIGLGGGYMGMYPCTAPEALEMYRERRIDIVGDPWLVPFLERLAAHEDFGLDELERAAPRFSIDPSPRFPD
jgi:ankyrin repeat protein